MTTTPRNTPVTINEVPWSDPSRGQPLPVNGRRVPEDGALCRPLIGARSSSRQWGREQPPGLERVPTPAPARRVAHAPMSVPECSQVLAVIWRRMYACSHSRTRRRSLAKRLELLDDHSRQMSAITTIRIELCSASSRLSLRSTLRAAALTPPPRSSKVALT
jgi:hypothetical protein